MSDPQALTLDDSRLVPSGHGVDAIDRADMRIEIVKREINQGALAGSDSAITSYAAQLVIAALDSFDAYCREEDLKAEFRRGFELGDKNGWMRAQGRRVAPIVREVDHE